MARNNSRGGRNNNPSGRNQYSDFGVIDMVRDRPIAAAAAAAGAAAAGLFLWSRRAQISNQLSGLGDQIGEWTDSMIGERRSCKLYEQPARNERDGRRKFHPRPFERRRRFERLGKRPGPRSVRGGVTRVRFHERMRGRPSGRPLVHALRNSRIAAPNSALVTELM